MAVSLPSFANIGQLATTIKSPIQGLAEGLAQGFSLRTQRRQVEIQQQKQDAINKEAARQAQIDAVLRKRNAASDKPHIRELAKVPGGGIKGYELDMAEKEQARKAMETEIKRADEDRQAIKFPLEQEKLKAETQKLLRDAQKSLTGTAKPTQVTKLHGEMVQAVQSGDRTQQVNIAANLAKERNIDISQDRKKDLSNQDAQLKLAMDSGKAVLDVFTNTTGAVERLKITYRSVVNQLEQAMPNSPMIKEIRARAKDPAADIQQVALDIFALDMVKAQLIREGRGQITEKQFTFMRDNLLNTFGLASATPEKAITALNMYMGKLQKERASIQSERMEPIKTILQEYNQQYGQQSTPPKQQGPSAEDIAFTAKKYGITEDEVRRRLQSTK